MKNNVLCIGCSHLSGAYDMTDHVVGPESWAWHLRKMYGRKDRYVTIPNPSQGIQKYAAVIEFLDRNDLLKDFTHCIIQMTQEPRTVFMDEREDDFYNMLPSHINSIEEFVNGNLIQSNPSYAALSGIERYVFEKYKDMFHKTTIKPGLFRDRKIDIDMEGEFLTFLEKTIPTLTQSFNARSALPVSYQYIKSTLEKNNIKMVSFDWWGKSAEQHEMLNGVMGDEYLFPETKAVNDILTEKQLWDIGKQTPLWHLDKRQARYVGEALKEYLDDREFF